MDNPKVDRYLKDKAMDHIDHALGRPLDPMGETYRNYFATNGDGSLAAIFKASPYWRTKSKAVPGGMMYFYVTPAGRKALADHLKTIGDPHRLFEVEWDGHTRRVVAVSAAKARYSEWLKISDRHEGLSFGEFQKTAKVRLAAAAQVPA